MNKYHPRLPWQIPLQLCHILAKPARLWGLLYAGRGGSMVVFAITSVAVPVYLNEISPVHLRSLSSAN